MSRFLANTIKLFSATVAGQILGILVTPVLSRLYSPADFGMYQLIFSLAGLLAVFSCLSYTPAIQLPKKDEDAANIVVLCLSLIVITTFFTTIFFFMFSSNIEQLLNVQGLSTYFILLPFAIISTSVSVVLVSWLSRKSEFGTIAKGNFYSSVSGKGISLGFGIISPSPFGLIFGAIMNDATIVLVLLRKTIGDFHLFQQVSYQRMKQMAYRYKQFPQYRVGADVAGHASMTVPPFMLAFYFSPTIVGYFAMALMIMRLPTKLLASAIYQVFYQKASAEKNRTGSIKNIVEMIHTRLISFGMFTCFIVMIIGPELFVFVLGSKWATAGLFAQIIAPWMFVAFISIPLLTIFNLMEKQLADLWFSVLQLITAAFAIFIGGIFADPVIAMVSMSITGVLLGGWVNIYTLKLAGVPILNSIQEIIRFFLISLVFCLPLTIAKYYSIQPIFLIGITILTSVFYYGLIIFKDSELRMGLKSSIKIILQKEG
jgi:lipopolysaccharide exporter